MSYTPLEVTGKVAVVIGSTSGIGRAIAHGLAEGADVIPTSRRMEQVEAAAKDYGLRSQPHWELHDPLHYCQLGLPDFPSGYSSPRTETRAGGHQNLIH